MAAPYPYDEDTDDRMVEFSHLVDALTKLSDTELPLLAQYLCSEIGTPEFETLVEARSIAVQRRRITEER